MVRYFLFVFFSSIFFLFMEWIWTFVCLWLYTYEWINWLLNCWIVYRNGKFHKKTIRHHFWIDVLLTLVISTWWVNVFFLCDCFFSHSVRLDLRPLNNNKKKTAEQKKKKKQYKCWKTCKNVRLIKLFYFLCIAARHALFMAWPLCVRYYCMLASSFIVLHVINSDFFFRFFFRVFVHTTNQLSPNHSECRSPFTLISLQIKQNKPHQTHFKCLNSVMKVYEYTVYDCMKNEMHISKNKHFTWASPSQSRIWWQTPFYKTRKEKMKTNNSWNIIFSINSQLYIVLSLHCHDVIFKWKVISMRSWSTKNCALPIFFGIEHHRRQFQIESKIDLCKWSCVFWQAISREYEWITKEKKRAKRSIFFQFSIDLIAFQYVHNLFITMINA